MVCNSALRSEAWTLTAAWTHLQRPLSKGSDTKATWMSPSTHNVQEAGPQLLGQGGGRDS